jgi:hypothetical protein
VSCGAELTPRTEAIWDRALRTATCLDCAGAADQSSDVQPAAQPQPLERGEAGASARRRYEQLHERREAHAREKLGRLSGVYLALSNEPQSTRAWGIGSSGERRLGAYLDTLNDDVSVIVLHDRRIPRTRANIDHIAITRSGVFVIDAKNYSGKVQKVDKGGWFSADLHLYVGRRDCSKLIPAMAKQVEVVSRALGEDVMKELALTVTPVLCFVDAEWSLFARPFQLEGVWVEWSKSLGQRLQAPGPLSEEQVRTLAELVAARLPAS